MQTYVRIDCPTEPLLRFLRRFSSVPHIAIAVKEGSHILYLGFDHGFSAAATLDFAAKHNCHAVLVPREEVIRAYQTDRKLVISEYSNFDPLYNRL